IRYATYTGPPESARRLAGRPGAAVVLPLGEGDTQAMLDGTAHFRPLVNGDSGFLPRPYTRAMELLQQPLGDDALRLLRAVGVRAVVTPDGRIDAVPSGDAAADVGPGTPAPTLWSTEAVVIDLGEPRLVERVVFEVSDADWVARPRVAV